MRRYLFITSAVLLVTATGVIAKKEPALPTSAQVKQKELALVRVNVTGQPYDYFRPWQKKAPQSKRALGAVLSKGRVLVTADLVANQNYVELERAESGEKTAANVEVIDYEANLALLEPADKNFLTGITPLDIAMDTAVGDQLPRLGPILFSLAGRIGDPEPAVVPLIGAVPFLFAAGVVFGYFIVLPAAVRFFVNFNSSEFNVLVQASQFYRFAATVLLAMGIFFQVPVVILAATRAGLVTVQQLRHNRRYAIVACAVVAAFLPGDLITLALETVPLYLLYEASILVAAFVGRRSAREAVASQAATSPPEGPAPAPQEPAERTVQEIIDHQDRDLSD